MKLSKENLILIQKSFDRYYIDYTPMDESISAEGYVSLTFEDEDDPHTDVTIDLSEVQVFYTESYQDISNTEEGAAFLEDLKELIYQII